MTYPVWLGAIVVTAANKGIRVKEGATTATTNLVEGTYYLRGDGAAGDFCAALKTALEAATASVNTYTVTVARSIAAGTAHTLITITRATGSDDFQILWADALTTLDIALVGVTASTADNASPKVSTQACASSWVSNDGYRRFKPFARKTVSVRPTQTGRVSGVERSDRMQMWKCDLGFVDGRRCNIEEALAGAWDTAEGFMDRFGPGAAVEMHTAEIDTGTTLAALSSSTLLDVVHFDEASLMNFDPEPLGDGFDLYDFSVTLHAQVAT
jgi:hypothetical protein